MHPQTWSALTAVRLVAWSRTMRQVHWCTAPRQAADTRLAPTMQIINAAGDNSDHKQIQMIKYMPLHVA